MEDLAGAVPHLQASERGGRGSGGQPRTQQPGDGGPLHNNDADPDVMKIEDEYGKDGTTTMATAKKLPQPKTHKK